MTVFRVEGHDGGTPGAGIKTANLWITYGDDSHAYLVDGNYVLGTVFTVKMVVADGVIRYEYNDKALPYTQQKITSGCCFKLGNYTQSNAKTAPTKTDDAYAETWVYACTLDHH